MKPNAYQEAIKKRDAARAKEHLSAATGVPIDEIKVYTKDNQADLDARLMPRAKVAKPTAQPTIKTAVKKPTKKAKKN